MSSPDAIVNRPALVIGAGRGLGASVGEQLMRRGARVVGVDCEAPNPAESRGYAEFMHLDFSGNEELIISRATSLLGGPPELVVFNAGYQSLRSLLHTSDEDLERAVEVNILANHRLAAHVARALVEAGKRGSLVFILSLHTDEVRGAPAYSGSKAYLRMLIRESAFELAPFGVRVNGLSPGIIDVELTRDTVVPMGRAATSSEVARLVLILLDDDLTPHVTGANWSTDGGLSLVNWVTDQSRVSGRLPPDASY